MNKYILIFLSFLFFLFGLVQFNDPDPLLWVTLYWVVCLLGIVVIYKHINKYVIIITGLVLCAYGIRFIDNFWQWIEDGMPSITGAMSKEKPSTELMREFFGLIIAGIGVIFIYRQNKGNREQ
jgi:hypothetical protein